MTHETETQAAPDNLAGVLRRVPATARADGADAEIRRQPCRARQGRTIAIACIAAHPLVDEFIKRDVSGLFTRRPPCGDAARPRDLRFQGEVCEGHTGWRSVLPTRLMEVLFQRSERRETFAVCAEFRPLAAKHRRL